MDRCGSSRLVAFMMVAFAACSTLALAQKTEVPPPSNDCITFAESIDVSSPFWNIPRGAAGSEGQSGEKLAERRDKAELVFKSKVFYAIYLHSSLFANGSVKRVTGDVVHLLLGSARVGEGDSARDHEIKLTLDTERITTTAVSVINNQDGNRWVLKRPVPVGHRSLTRADLDSSYENLVNAFKAQNPGARVTVDPFLDSNFDAAIEYYGSYLNAAGAQVCRSPSEGLRRDTVAVGVDPVSGQASGSFENRIYQ